MNLVTLIPIAKGIPRDELSYFSARDIALGTLVTVPFGKRTIQGVVIDIHPVRDVKSLIKQSNFALRNITEIHSDAILPREVFLAAQDTARWYAQPVGPVLKTMLPEKLFEEYIHHPQSFSYTKPPFTTRYSIQAPTRDRISYYKTLIRENFAKQMSTLIVTPSRIHAESLGNELASGLGDKLLIIHGYHTPSRLQDLIHRALHHHDTLVVVTTPAYASILRADWATLIIERASSSHYRYSFSPIFDTRHYLEHLFGHLGCVLVFGDHLLDASLRMRIHLREITEIRSTVRIMQPPQVSFVNMKPEPTARPSEKSPVKIREHLTETHPAGAFFSEEVRTLLDNLSHHPESLVMVTSRTGLAPLTACRDCGTLVTCEQCGTPLVLHRKSTSSSEHPARIYMCHTCLTSTPPYDHCKVCSGWRLAPLGVSTDGIRSLLEEHYPHLPTFIADGDHTTTLRQVQKMIHAWQKTPGSVLIATPFIIPYLPELSLGCIVSSDSLLSLPTYTGNEYALGMIMSFLEKITGRAIIQTRLPDHEVIRTLREGALPTFLDESLSLLRQFHYPPYVALIKITFQVSHEEVRAAQEYSEQIFNPWNPEILVKRASQPQSFLVQTIVRIPRDMWRDPTHPLHEIVRTLGTSVTLEVDSDRVI